MAKEVALVAKLRCVVTGQPNFVYWSLDICSVVVGVLHIDLDAELVFSVLDGITGNINKRFLCDICFPWTVSA